MIQTLTPFIRIGLRIFGGFMIGKGWVDEETASMFTTSEMVGAVALVISETWYLAANKYDWNK